jgi:hypothetical protein
MAESAKVMSEADLDASLILFSIWTEAVKHFAENSKGNVIFLDGSTEGMEKTMKQLLAIEKLNKVSDTATIVAPDSRHRTT